MRLRFALLASVWSAATLAQSTLPTTYKCVDERRQVTYSNVVCEKQGLRDAGPVADRTTTMPFTEPPRKPAPKPEATPPRQESSPQIKPVSPLIEKLVK